MGRGVVPLELGFSALGGGAMVGFLVGSLMVLARGALGEGGATLGVPGVALGVEERAPDMTRGVPGVGGAASLPREEELPVSRGESGAFGS